MSAPAPPRTAARLAWSICAACVAGTIGGIVLAALNRHLDSDYVLLAVVLLTYPLVGALIAARQPRNPTGWELCALGLCFTLQFSSDPYARYALLTSPGSLPGAVAVALIGGLSFAPIFVLTVVLLPLSFPTGRLLGPRWRLVVVSGLAFMLLALVGNGLRPGNLVVSGVGVVRSPVAVSAAWTPLLDVLLLLAGVSSILSVGGAVASVVVRFRGARGVKRQQLKWYSYAAALLPVPFIAHDLLPPPVYITLFIVVLPLLPISIGIAIGRYRLYEIDRIINRTVVYALLTAILGAGYAGLVLGLAQLFGGIGRPPPSWAVVGATLAVAAAFRPARRRVQAVVDRRRHRWLLRRGHPTEVAASTVAMACRPERHVATPAPAEALQTALAWPIHLCNRLVPSTFVAMPLRSPRPGGWRGFLRVLAGRGEMPEIWRR